MLGHALPASGVKPRYPVRTPAFAKAEKKPGKRVAKHKAKPPADGACLRSWSSRLQPRGEQRGLLRRLFVKAVHPLYNKLAKFVNGCRDTQQKWTDTKLENLATEAAKAVPEIGELPATMIRSVVVQVAQACETSMRKEEKARYVHDLWVEDGALRRAPAVASLLR